MSIDAGARVRLWSCRIAVGMLAGCSTLAPLPSPQECESDDDCPNEGDLCAPDTRVCVPNSNLWPIADLGFDLQEVVGGQLVFRAEVSACDREMTVTQSNLSVRGRDLTQTFELEAFVRTPEDIDAPTLEDLLDGTMELSQASRFSRGPLVPPRIDYPTLEQSGELLTLAPTTVRWPRYHPDDDVDTPPVLRGGGFVQWRLLPDGDAPMLQMLVPPRGGDACTVDTDCCELDQTGEACDPEDPNICLPGLGQCSIIGNPQFLYRARYDPRCSRDLIGEMVVVDGETLETRGPVSGAQLTVRHADTSGAPKLGVHAIDDAAPADREPMCTTDAECIVGEQLCDPSTRQCVLALAGRTADSGTMSTAEDGQFGAEVYTYCEIGAEPGNPALLRSFTISATPPGPLAALSYTFDTSIAAFTGDVPPDARVPSRLCVPDWGVSVPLELQLDAESIALIGSGADEYRCCDVGCLPATAEEAASAEPSQLARCDGRTASGALPEVTVSATLALDAAERLAWQAADCQLPDGGAGGIVGGIRRRMDCSGASSDATCIAPDLAAGADGSPRDYGLRIESPVGSLFASDIVAVAVEPAGAPQQLALRRRVLVRGRVVLDAIACAQSVDGDCGSEGAIIRAERLRMPGEGVETIPGPYFHEVSTFFDPVDDRRGGYVLPLDPGGAYLMTALPRSGSQGGPASISILDLRDVDDGAELERDLVLRSGVLVSLDLVGFDRRAQILPLDRGSWRDLVHPGRVDDPDPATRTVDLNATAECLQPPDEVPQGCRIRRLISGSSLSASQVGQVRFTARTDPDAGRCPG